MNKTRAFVFLALTAVLIAIVLVYPNKFNHQFESKTVLWGFELETIESGQNVEFFLFQNDGEKLEVTRISQAKPEAAVRLIDEKVQVFAALFEEQRVGYSGQHTEFISCPDSLKPRLSEKKIENGTVRYFTGFANQRFAHGACLQEDAQYLALSIYMYCPEHQILFDISYFVPRDMESATASFIEKLDCVLP